MDFYVEGWCMRTAGKESVWIFTSLSIAIGVSH